MFGINLGRRQKTKGELILAHLPPSRHQFPLDMPLLAFSKSDPWTLGDACTGTQIMGGTGSGKTSGSGRAIATAFLRAGFGGLVLCAKPTEADLWRQYAKETGREKSLIVFGADGDRRFNFLDYELRRNDRLDAENLVSLFLRIMDGAKGQEDRGGDNAIFRDAASFLLKYAFMALYSAWGRVTLNQIMQFIETAPRTPKQQEDKRFLEESFHVVTLSMMRVSPTVPMHPADTETVFRYFRYQWPGMADRTRTSVELNLTTMVSPLLTGYMRELFCTTTNTIPEMTHEGAVIVVDLPIKEFDQAGILAAHIWKYLFQRAAERRKDTASVTTRPVFLWADECQFFMSKYDMEFQSTARSSKACTVYLTQNLPTYFERMKGTNPQHATNALLGNFQTQIFHQNLDADTNRYAAELVGKNWQIIRSQGTNTNRQRGTSSARSNTYGHGTSYTSSSGGQTSTGMSGNFSWGDTFTTNQGESYGRSETYSQQVEYDVLPSTFSRLKKGGRGQAPEAIVIQGGRQFRYNGLPYMTCVFPQR